MMSRRAMWGLQLPVQGRVLRTVATYTCMCTCHLVRVQVFQSPPRLPPIAPPGGRREKTFGLTACLVCVAVHCH